MILFEILNETVPWKDENFHVVPSKVLKGKRPTLSSKLTDSGLIGLQELMEDCWKQEPKERLTFDKVIKELEKLDQ
jgi:hypothetical protein